MASLSVDRRSPRGCPEGNSGLFIPILGRENGNETPKTCNTTRTEISLLQLQSYVKSQDILKGSCFWANFPAE